MQAVRVVNLHRNGLGLRIASIDFCGRKAITGLFQRGETELNTLCLQRTLRIFDNLIDARATGGTDRGGQCALDQRGRA